MTVWMRRFLILIPLAVLLIAVVFYFAFKASLPALDGEMPVGQNLSAAASISRDALGIATIDADNRLDAAFALGFAHGQDRFFQMDIQRRYAAGEMSALLGDKTLKRDKSMRLNQFRQRALQTLSLLTADSLQLLERYVAGVNRGLSSLGNSPWEYLLLGQEPQRWRPEDSLLVSAFMFSRMTARIPQNEYARELLLRSGGEELLSFLQPPGTQWDTAIDGTTMAANAIPAAEVWSLSDTSSLAEELAAITSTGLPPMIGSNSWAVSRLMSEHGGGILANDPHLGFNLPHIWYRTQINYRDQNRQAVQLNGVSFPGLPSIAIGTNGKVAWGMTNSAGDWADLIAVEIKDDQYKTADGWKPLISHVEIIEVAGEEPIEWVVQRTEWGPVVEFNGEKLAHRWLAHFPQALDAFALLELDSAKTTAEALALGQRAGVSPFNMLVADMAGDIGWSLTGRLPQRGQTRSDRVISWQNADESWQGWLAPEDYPVLQQQDRRYLWTANNRIIGGDDLQKIGVGQYELGARGWLIEQDLKQMQTVDEQQLIKPVFNNKAVMLESWYHHLSDFLTQLPNPDDDLDEAKQVLDGWTGRAQTDDAAYTLVKTYRKQFRKHLNNALIVRMLEQGIVKPQTDLDRIWLLNRQSEGALIQLRDQHPEHWLPADIESWKSWQLAMLKAAVDELKERHGNLADARWGSENRLKMHHPVAAALPTFLAQRLNMRDDELAGDADMPLAQHPHQGQSMRFIVAPGREEQGLLTMPGGQSGHPLSPFYNSGHEDWIAFKHTPLLPGKPIHRLRLNPQSVSP